jgi:signal transduction histidine kinase
VEVYQATANAGGLRLTSTVATNIPLIRTRSTRLRQITSNLLSNAIKYTPTGAVTVTVSRRAPADDGEGVDWVLVEVTDTGLGIAPDKVDFIFQEFGRVGGSETPGAGLGLAISRLLAQALGGRITVASEVGRGSTFTLWLPLVPGTGGEVTIGAVTPNGARLP